MAEEKLMKFAKYLMIATGMWQLEFTESSGLKAAYYAYSVYHQVNFATFTASLTVGMVIIVANGGNINTLSESMGITIIWVIILAKLTICKTAKVKRLVNESINGEKIIFSSGNPESIAVYNVQIKYSRVINVMAFFMSFMVALSMLVANLAVRDKIDRMNVKMNESIAKPELYWNWFPFDKDEHRTGTNVIYAYCLYNAALTNSAAQVFFVSTITYAGAQLRVLQISFRDIGANDSADIFEKVERLIEKHQGVVDFVRDLNGSMKYLMLLEYTLSSLNVASVSIQVTSVEPSVTSLAFPIIYLCLLVFQVFVLGWYSNEIKMQSLALGDAAYKSQWYEQNDKVKKLILMMIMRSQRPLVLAIGPFGAMTTQSALTIMKAAYSYVTLMKNSH